MVEFKEIFDTYNWEEVKQSILSKTGTDVLQALQKGRKSLEDFKALISPAAMPYLEQMAQLSHSLTQKRFGKTIQMYVPLYLSNECQNICTYCAFSYDNKIKRKTLSDDEILKEVTAIKQMGYDHVLLVTGEANQTVGVEYLKHAIKLIRSHFSNISIEVQPLDQAEYELLLSEGLHTVLVYQETYHRENYKAHHPKGKKSNFDSRLETPDRLGRAGVHKIGLGVLIGLEDWRTDCFFTAAHLDYLEKTYWQTKYSISFPRLRPIEVGTQENSLMKSFTAFMNDKELVQLICAYRIFNEEVELSISTRENEKFRNHIIKLGITSMSAGSKTNPGGYVVAPQSLEQFEISDERSPKEIAAVIKQQGYEAVWKDWDTILNGIEKMKPEELKRYARHIILSEIGLEGQQKLKQAKVLVIGAGGLGCPVLQYLTAAGVGTIGIVDFDKVDESNLQRQVLYAVEDVGKYKAEVAKDKLGKQNHFVNHITHVTHLTSANALEIISSYDIVVDGSDNFATRYLVNDACVILNKVLVFASIYKFEGQLSVFNYKGGPTYRCLYPEPPADGEIANCAEIGVIGVLPGIAGTLQANEVIKVITGIGEILNGKLLTFDSLTMQFNTFDIAVNPENRKINKLIDYDFFCGTIKEITSIELKQKIKLKEDFQLIDVREQEEYQLKNIGGMLIPLNTLEKNLDKISLDKEVVVHCASGARSKKAAGLLREKGFENIFNLKNGLLDF